MNAPSSGSDTLDLPAEQIRAHLQEILQSKAFAMSRRSCELLTFVVEEALHGHEHELKERTIGAAVFGRQVTYDTSQDAIVRINASEIRKRLTMFYAECVKPVPLQISLPAGGYIPQFIRTERAPICIEEGAGSPLPNSETQGPNSSLAFVMALAPSAMEGSAAKPRPSRFQTWFTRRRVLITAAIVLSVAAYPSLRWVWALTHPSLLEQFWRPVLRAQGPIYLVTSSVPAYIAYRSDQSGTTGSSGDMQSAEPADRKGELGEKYVLTLDQFIGRGDMLANERITNLLRVLGNSRALKTSDTINLREMSNCSVVLIGYASTTWAAISKNLRYFIDDDNRGMITDFGRPTAWYPHNLTEDLHTDEDFAIVARVYIPETRSVVVLVSGATQYGTEAAADLATNPEMLGEALKERPKDWLRKNIEIVLHIKVIGNTPAAPEVVATDFR
jgi:hypothetical protein